MFKKFFAAVVLSSMLISPALCANYEIEHLDTNKNQKVDLVKVTKVGSVLQKENYIVVNFAQNFNSKYYKEGDYVQFNFENDLRTKEGTLVIPFNSSLIAKVASIQKPKWFSRNAKVYLEFTHIILPNGDNIPVALQLADKKCLKKGAGATAVKIVAYTAAVGSTGCSLGSAIGVAAGNTIAGLIIGGSIGGGVGLVAGVVSPGLHYKAKKGDSLLLEVKDNIEIPAQTKK